MKKFLDVTFTVMNAVLFLILYCMIILTSQNHNTAVFGKECPFVVTAIQPYDSVYNIYVDYYHCTTERGKVLYYTDQQIIAPIGYQVGDTLTFKEKLPVK